MAKKSATPVLKFVKTSYDGSGYLVDENRKILAKVTRMYAVPAVLTHWKHSLSKKPFKYKRECIADAKKEALKRLKGRR